MTNVFDAIRSIRYRRAIRAQVKQARRQRAKKQRHQHTFVALGNTDYGWAIITCTVCGHEELA